MELEQDKLYADITVANSRFVDLCNKKDERIRELEEALAERDEMIIGLTSKKLNNKK